jgi:hypothetical protein
MVFSSRVRSPRLVFALVLLPLLVQGCVYGTHYLATPKVRTGAYVDIWNFSDNEINPDDVDQLYVKVAHLMGISPEGSPHRLQVLVVSLARINQMHVTFRALAKTQDRIATALYIPSRDQILISHFDRTLLAHELAHYFTFHYLPAPRFIWEEIADEIVQEPGIGQVEGR